MEDFSSFIAEPPDLTIGEIDLSASFFVLEIEEFLDDSVNIDIEVSLEVVHGVWSVWFLYYLIFCLYLNFFIFDENFE